MAMKLLLFLVLLPSCTVSVGVGGRFEMWQSEDRLESSDAHEISKLEF